MAQNLQIHPPAGLFDEPFVTKIPIFSSSHRPNSKAVLYFLWAASIRGYSGGMSVAMGQSPVDLGRPAACASTFYGGVAGIDLGERATSARTSVMLIDRQCRSEPSRLALNEFTATVHSERRGWSPVTCFLVLAGNRHFGKWKHAIA